MKILTLEYKLNIININTDINISIDIKKNNNVKIYYYGYGPGEYSGKPQIYSKKYKYNKRNIFTTIKEKFFIESDLNLYNNIYYYTENLKFSGNDIVINSKNKQMIKLIKPIKINFMELYNLLLPKDNLKLYNNMIFENYIEKKVNNYLNKKYVVDFKENNLFNFIKKYLLKLFILKQDKKYLCNYPEIRYLHIHNLLLLLKDFNLDYKKYELLINKLLINSNIRLIDSNFNKCKNMLEVNCHKVFDYEYKDEVITDEKIIFDTLLNSYNVLLDIINHILDLIINKILNKIISLNKTDIKTKDNYIQSLFNKDTIINKKLIDEKKLINTNFYYMNLFKNDIHKFYIYVINYYIPYLLANHYDKNKLDIKNSKENIEVLYRCIHINENDKLNWKTYLNYMIPPYNPLNYYIPESRKCINLSKATLDNNNNRVLSSDYLLLNDTNYFTHYGSCSYTSNKDLLFGQNNSKFNSKLIIKNKYNICYVYKIDDELKDKIIYNMDYDKLNEIAMFEYNYYDLGINNLMYIICDGKKIYNPYCKYNKNIIKKFEDYKNSNTEDKTYYNEIHKHNKKIIINKRF